MNLGIAVDLAAWLTRIWDEEERLAKAARMHAVFDGTGVRVPDGLAMPHASPARFPAQGARGMAGGLGMRRGLIRLLCIILRHPTKRVRAEHGWREYCPCEHIHFLDVEFVIHDRGRDGSLIERGGTRRIKR